MNPSFFNFLLAHPRKIITLFLLLTLVASYGLQFLSFTNDFRVYFSEQNPQLEAFERFEEEFSKQEHLFFGIIAKKDSIFTPSNLALIEEITERALDLPFTYRVFSLSNYQFIHAKDDTLHIDDFIKDAHLLTPADLSRIRKHALSEEALLNYFISPDEKLSGINVSVNLPEGNLQASPMLVQEARQLRSELTAKYPDVDIIIGGSVASNAALSEGIKRDLSTLIPASYLLIVLGLWVFLRSFWAMFVTLVVVSLSVLATFGGFGFSHFVLTPISGFVPSVILTIAVADCVHILVSYRHALSQGQRARAALKEAMRINVAPVFLTTITTIIGVLCLNFSDSPPYHDLGNMVAVGVFWAWLFSMVLLPCLIHVFPVHRFSGDGLLFPMHKLANFIDQFQNILIISIGFLVCLAIFFLRQNTITENWVDYFDDSFEVTRSLNAIEEHINSLHRLEYILPAGDVNGVHQHQYLKEIAAFEKWLSGQKEVSHTSSLTYPIKKMHYAMHNEDPAYLSLPDDNALIAQYLLLYELSANNLGLSHLINLDHSSSRLTVFLSRMNSDGILDFEQRASNWLRQNTRWIKPTEATSLDIIFAHIAYRNITSLLFGTVVALVLISFILLFALRSFKLGLISLIPNLVPATLAYGAWGLFVGHIDMALSIVICMSLGIVVDDTVHFLSKYRRAKTEKQLSSFDAIHYSFRSVGTALITTSVVLVLGFSILIFSGMTPTRETGTLLAVTLSFALLVDFFLLPPLLLKLDKSRDQ